MFNKKKSITTIELGKLQKELDFYQMLFRNSRLVIICPAGKLMDVSIMEAITRYQNNWTSEWVQGPVQFYIDAPTPRSK